MRNLFIFLISIYSSGLFAQACDIQTLGLGVAPGSTMPVAVGETSVLEFSIFNNGNDDNCEVPINGVEAILAMPAIDIFEIVGIAPGTSLTYFSVTSMNATELILENTLAAIPDGMGDFNIQVEVIATNVGSAEASLNIQDFGSTSNNIANDEGAQLLTATMSLPVRIKSFGLTGMECDNATLAWTTASETNNDGFVVERSFGDLSNFTDVGFVKGKGTVAGESSYEFTDEYPNDIIEPYVYYRLRQVDLDGGSKTFDVIKGKRDCDFYIDGFVVTPNPASNETFIKSDLDRAELRTAAIINNVGQIVDRIQVTTSNQKINLEGYQPGVYSVRMEIDGKITTKRFIKVQ